MGQRIARPVGSAFGLRVPLLGEEREGQPPGHGRPSSSLGSGDLAVLVGSMQQMVWLPRRDVHVDTPHSPQPGRWSALLCCRRRAGPAPAAPTPSPAQLVMLSREDKSWAVLFYYALAPVVGGPWALCLCGCFALNVYSCLFSASFREPGATRDAQENSVQEAMAGAALVAQSAQVRLQLRPPKPMREAARDAALGDVPVGAHGLFIVSRILVLRSAHHSLVVQLFSEGEVVSYRVQAYELPGEPPLPVATGPPVVLALTASGHTGGHVHRRADRPEHDVAWAERLPPLNEASEAFTSLRDVKFDGKTQRSGKKGAAKDNFAFCGTCGVWHRVTAAEMADANSLDEDTEWDCDGEYGGATADQVLMAQG
jgi:hypothetical protein